MEQYKEIERSIIKKFRKDIWSKFVKGVKDYELIQENDNIMVCISGGKDSFCLAKCIQELERHGNVPFKAHYVIMDPGYNDFNRNLILDNAKLLNVPVEVFNTEIFDTVASLKEGNPCYLCARMRRGYLYNKAKELGCNKIALGHHFDDVIETTLLSMFYGSEIKTMLPKLHSENYEGLELIRPMYLVKESSIIAWRKFNNLTFTNCACRFTENCSINDDSTSKRLEMKKLIANLRKINPEIDYNIFKSLDNINLNCVLGYKKEGKYTSFLDDYENKR
jgi:tRNA(Ile)-lysidine synthase TilS/MesJ